MSEPPIYPPEPLPEPMPERRQTLDALTHGDVVPFAKRSCLTCHGTGEFSVLGPRPAQPVNSTEPRPERRRTSKLCGCALRRFLKRHATDTIREPKSGRLYWLPGRKPA